MPRTLLLLAAALALSAALPKAEAQPYLVTQTSSAEQKIEAALGSPAQLEFIETPLQDVVDYLKDFHRIEIQIDRTALEDVGLDASSMPVTTNLKGISLRSALNLVLRDHDLTYVVQDEVLLITTPQAAAGRLTTKVYRVGSVVGSQNSPNEGPAPYHVLIQVITATVAPDSWTNVPSVWYGGMGMGGMDDTGMGGGYYSSKATPPKKAEAGTKGSIAGASFGGTPLLVVSQTYHVHRQIVALLEELRGAAGIKQPAPAEAVKKAPATAPPKAPPKPPRKASSAPAPDPFGGKSSAKPAADPFGDEPAKKAPAPRPASEADDPFSR